jgi:hypothetical protein
MEVGTFVSGQLAMKNKEEQLKLAQHAYDMEMKKERERLQLEKEQLELDKERHAFESSAKEKQLELLEKELMLKEKASKFEVVEKQVSK